MLEVGEFDPWLFRSTPEALRKFFAKIHERDRAEFEAILDEGARALRNAISRGRKP